MSICVMRSYFQRDYNVPFLTSEQENMLSTSDYMSIGRGGGGNGINQHMHPLMVRSNW